MIQLFVGLVIIYYVIAGLIWLSGRLLRTAAPPLPPRRIPPGQAWLYAVLSDLKKRPLGRNQIMYRDRLHSNRLIRTYGGRELHKLRPTDPRAN